MTMQMGAALMAGIALGGLALAGPVPPGTVDARPGSGREPASYSPQALQAVSADSADDAWAVGYQDMGNRDLVEHWDGASWSRVSSPNFGSGTDQLRGVVALAPDDVWAVGSYGVGAAGNLRTLALHWDGSGWTKVQTPSPGPSATLTAVSAVAPDDVWAVGDELHEQRTQHKSRSLTMHWDGTTWSRVPSPSLLNHLYGTRMRAVTVVAHDDVWALGNDYYSFQPGGTLYLHWDGSRWRRVAPAAGDRMGCVGGIAASDASHVWAVGGSHQRALLEAWDGTAWHDQGEWPSGRYSAVTAISDDDAWAVGYGGNCDMGYGLAFAKHWDGTQWKPVAIAVPDGVGTDVLLGVTAVSSDDVWAVGWAVAQAARPLIEHWDGVEWSVVEPER